MDNIKPYNPLDYLKTKEDFDHYVSALVEELERENHMMRARNERLEKEIKWLETMVNNLQMELLNYRSHPAAKTANSTTT